MGMHDIATGIGEPPERSIADPAEIAILETMDTNSVFEDDTASSRASLTNKNALHSALLSDLRCFSGFLPRLEYRGLIHACGSISPNTGVDQITISTRGPEVTKREVIHGESSAQGNVISYTISQDPPVIPWALKLDRGSKTASGSNLSRNISTVKTEL